MTTISFKLPEPEARKLRAQARLQGITVSEVIRHALFQPQPPSPVTLQTCPLTGAEVFAPQRSLEPLTTKAVREILADFP